MWDALTAHFTRCSSDPEVRAVIFTGEGGHFCSGSDLDAIDLSNDIASGLARLKRANRMMLAIYNIEKPVIAAVRGPAAGVGWSLALACDFIVAAEDARRSEEHTSELQSLMRSSYAVFCLKKKTTIIEQKTKIK